ncbi:MAG: SAM-dependent methyltransferase, partial [Nocardioidaceae bacterium]
VELRRKARKKFGLDADLMYFTASGLEQSTHGLVAAHRAHRLAALPAGSVLDLCCGIGADLVAFARAGLDVNGVERDPVTAAIATANLSALGCRGQVRVGEAETTTRDGYDVTFADPARRGAAGRVFNPRSYSPPWTFVSELLRECAVVKVAPGIPHSLVPDDVEAEWVSLDGQLKEAALWAGQPGVSRRATLLRSRGDTGAVTDADDTGAVSTQEPGRYVYEPDDAVIRAHLVTAVAARVKGWLLDEHLAYVSSDHLVRTPLARAYEVIDVLPFKEKQLRAALRARDVGPLTIKKRGVQVTPETLRSRLALTGSRAATIVLTRTPKSAVALLVEPID